MSSGQIIKNDSQPPNVIRERMALASDHLRREIIGIAIYFVYEFLAIQIFKRFLQAIVHEISVSFHEYVL